MRSATAMFGVRTKNFGDRVGPGAAAGWSRVRRMQENPKAAMDKLKKERNAAKNIEMRKKIQARYIQMWHDMARCSALFSNCKILAFLADGRSVVALIQFTYMFTNFHGL